VPELIQSSPVLFPLERILRAVFQEFLQLLLGFFLPKSPGVVVFCISLVHVYFLAAFGLIGLGGGRVFPDSEIAIEFIEVGFHGADGGHHGAFEVIVVLEGKALCLFDDLKYFRVILSYFLILLVFVFDLLIALIQSTINLLLEFQDFLVAILVIVNQSLQKHLLAFVEPVVLEAGQGLVAQRPHPPTIVTHHVVQSPESAGLGNREVFI
jgi:hypothetical protein